MANPLLVSIGAGQRTLEGWINTDAQWHSRYFLDLLKPWPVVPGSVARIYADNVIEHFTVPDARIVLKHAYDALQPGGRIRLTTPDVERTAMAYLHDAELAARHLDRHRRAGYEVYYPVDLLRITFAECGHHLGFCHDSYSLCSELERAGFRLCERCEVGCSPDTLLCGLEARGEPTEVATALIVEAVK